MVDFIRVAISSHFANRLLFEDESFEIQILFVSIAHDNGAAAAGNSRH